MARAHRVYRADDGTSERAPYVIDADGIVRAPRVNEDFLSGVRSGVNGTPTFYLNGVRYDGSYELETLHTALEGAVASQRG